MKIEPVPLSALHKRQQPDAKSELQDVWMAATKEDVTKALELFVQTYQAKYSGAVECVMKDRGELLCGDYVAGA